MYSRAKRVMIVTACITLVSVYAAAQGGITKPKARTFVRYCLKKLRTELAIRGARHG